MDAGGGEKVKAHLSLDDADIDEAERFRRVGNDAADRAARSGADDHPAPDAAQLSQIDRAIRCAQDVVHLAASVLPLWPRTDLS